MRKGFLDLLASERGVLCIVLVVAATLLAITKVISGDAWLTYTKWICTILVASKTVTGAVETWTGSNTPSVAQPVP